MKNYFFSLALLITIFFVYSFYYQDETSDTKDRPKDGVFIHVTHGNKHPHRVLMALNLAEKMAPDKDVILYFDIDGIETLLKDAPDLSFTHCPSSHAQIKKLLDMGIKMMACSGCLKSIGKTPEDLREGVVLADKEQFFNFTSGRILTMNY
jgi:predicted peroxiredoxin